MTPTPQSLSLFLFLLNHGIAFGAGIYEHQIVIPRWIAVERTGRTEIHPEAMRQDDPGRKFWAFVTTVPLSVLLLINGWFAFQGSVPNTKLLICACAMTLLERVTTFAYFIPGAIRIMRIDSAPTSQEIKLAASWRMFNKMRLLLSLMAWILTVLSFGQCS